MSPESQVTRALVGGSVLDGLGSAAVEQTVLVRDGRVLDLLPAGAALPPDVERVDCSGQVVAPGFIDIHSHADNVPFLAEDDVSKIEQGVTTEVTGNCGFSLAPVEAVHADDLAALVRRIFPPVPLEWNTFGELQELATAGGLVTHHAPLVGHNALRVAAMGAVGEPADREAVARMRVLLEAALEDGAFGLSSGLIYPPGVFSEPDELGSLTEMLGADRIYATHMRSESTHVFDSLAESLAAVDGRCRLHVSHLKIGDRRQWGRMPEALDVLDRARARGQQVTQDAYPYTAGSTMLTAALPPWFHDGGAPAVLSRLQSADARRRAAHDLEHDRSFENMVANGGWDGVVVSSTRSHRHEGWTIAALADHLGCAPFEALAQVLLEEELQATMVVHMMHEDDVRAVLAHPRTAIGSDGLPPGTGGKPHPRTYGTFPRVLGRYARAEGLLHLPDAVRKMTALPADILGLTDRGRIRRGAVADLVTFDPDTVLDLASYEEPAQRPRGIDLVLQEGEPVVRHGAWLGVRRGRRLHPA